MTREPPRRPAPPPAPNLTTYRPSDERRTGGPPPIDQRFTPPLRPARTGRRPPGRRRRSWLRIAGWIFGSLALLTAAAVAALVVLAPVDLIRDQLIREVKNRTGRDLTISGNTTLSVFPTFGIAMGGVTLSFPPGMGAEPFVKMKRLDAQIALAPLLSGQISIDRLVLTEPIFELLVDTNGRRSWEFAELAGPPTVMVAQAPAQPSPGQGSAGSASKPIPPELQEFLRNSTAAESGSAGTSAARRRPMQDFMLGEIRIDNGMVRYRDERVGVAEELHAINLQLTGQSLASPIEAKGDLALRGERIDVEARIGSPKALLEDRPSRTALSLASPRFAGSYDGSLSLAKGPQLDGSIKLESGSLRSLAAWIGVRLADGPGLGAFTLESELKTGPAWVALDNAKAQLDQVSGNGSISVAVVAGRPNVKANLRLGALDLNPYLEPNAGTGNDSSAGPPDGNPSGPAMPPGFRTGPQVKGFLQRSGWSDAYIDVSGLALMDADVRLSFTSLVYRDMKVGTTQVAVGLKNNMLRTTIEDMRLYGGQGRGIVTLEPAGPATVLGANLTFEGVAALAFLKDATGFDWVDGKAKIQIAVAGSGSSERTIVEGLNGKAEFSFADGAIVGFNIPQMIRGISQGRIPSFNRVPSERTEFSEAAASFQIRNGVAETKDLRAFNPMLRLTGTGAANLGQRQIDATLRPKLVTAGPSSGQPSGNPSSSIAGDLSGLELPVQIKGAWERPQFRADIDGILKSNSQAVDTLKEIGKQLKQGNTDGLRDLLQQFRKR